VSTVRKLESVDIDGIILSHATALVWAALGNEALLPWISAINQQLDALTPALGWSESHSGVVPSSAITRRCVSHRRPIALVRRKLVVKRKGRPVRSIFIVYDCVV